MFFKWIHSDPDFIYCVKKSYGIGVCKILIRLRDDNKTDFECPVALKEYRMHM